MGPGHGREEDRLCTRETPPEAPALHRKAREEKGLSRGHGAGVRGPPALRVTSLSDSLLRCKERGKWAGGPSPP